MASHVKTMIPAVFSVWSLLLLSFIIYYLWDTFTACFTVYWFNFSSADISFSLFSKSQLWLDLPFIFLYASSSWCFVAWLGWRLPLFCYLYIRLFFFELIALMGLSTVLPPYSLTLFQHGKLSTTANSTHFPLHPACLLFLPVVSKHHWLQVSTVLWKLRGEKKHIHIRNDYGVWTQVNM